MRIRNSCKGDAAAMGGDKIELQMTPMIDIVFQLLVFFVMTYKIVAQEGDFSIKSPQESYGGCWGLPPLMVRLAADETGKLTDIVLGTRSLGTNFAALRAEVLGIVGTERGPGSIAESLEVELNCDRNLRYQYVIEAITHVSGYVENGRVIPMIETIKFARHQQHG